MSDPIIYYYREVRGCLPPKEDPSKHRLYWRRLDTASNWYVFFTRTWGKQLNIWVPSSSDIKVLSGGHYNQTTKYDSGKNTGHHSVWAEVNGRQLELSFEVGDHRSIQRFTREQLSNGDNVLQYEENVE